MSEPKFKVGDRVIVPMLGMCGVVLRVVAEESGRLLVEVDFGDELKLGLDGSDIAIDKDQNERLLL